MLSYGVAVASITVAVAGARLLDIYLIAAPVSLLLCAIMFTAWVGGVRPAALAVVLSLLAFKYYDVTPTHSFAVNIQEVPRIMFFALSALFVVWLSATQRHAVQALKKINEALHAENAERRRAEQALEEVAGGLINAQEEERSRIGRELHDHISQTLGVLTIKIDQLRAGGDIPPGVGSALDELRRDTTDITEDVHRLSHRLHSSTLDYLGLVPALQKLVSEFSERHGIAITFAHALAPAPLASAVALCLFRVAEEALTNIAKHSNARSANINVTGGPDGLRLTVEDAGTGFDTTTVARKAGLGFVSMQERLRVLHGTIHVDSAPTRGTRIVACVPPTVLTGARGGPLIDRGRRERRHLWPSLQQSPYPPSQLAASRGPSISSRESQKATVRILTSRLAMKRRFETPFRALKPLATARDCSSTCQGVISIRRTARTSITPSCCPACWC